MSQLTDTGRQALGDLAQKHGLSTEAVEAMARAMARGGGTMAQFDIPELGGNGQWMAGGMTMVGDMFNHGLKARVDALCGDLSGLMAGAALFVAPATMAGAAWWPAELGQPASVGGQNTARYAYFPQARRVAFDPGTGAPVILLDTGEHQIGGWSQQQAGPGDPFLGVSFSSQFGQYPLASLPRVAASTDAPVEPAPVEPSPEPPQAASPSANAPEPAADAAPAPPARATETAPETVAPPAPSAPQGSPDQILSTIEKLARLRDAGALTDDEFAAKKAELLARL